jgi:MraZ protein
LAFRGHYEHSLDAKNRLSIPAKFRASFSSGVVLAKDSEPCVAIWTPDQHERIIDSALEGRNPLDPARKKIQRYFQANSFDQDLDSAGRVTLPPPLIAHAGVEKEVVVAAAGDHLEVWSKERWEQEASALDADIVKLTQELGHHS